MALVVAVGLVALLIALPQWTVDRVLEHEADAWRGVTELAARAEEFRKSGACDADADGIGEPPTIATLLATSRDGFVPSPDALAFRRDGYWFTVLTPGADRRAAAPSGDSLLADYAETAYAIVAWPVVPGTSGMRAYLWTPADAKVLRHVVDGFPYGGPNRPPLPPEPLIGREGAQLRARAIHSPGSESLWRPPRESQPD